MSSNAIQGPQPAIDAALPEKLPGPRLEVKRNGDGQITRLSLTGGDLPCGSPKSVTLTVGKDGQVAAQTRESFVPGMDRPDPDRTHAATRSDLAWLKSQVMKSGSLSDADKVALMVQIDRLMETAPIHAPGPFIPKAPDPQYIDDPSQIRRLQGQEPVMYAQAEFPDPTTRRKG
jgi:hypothetical protein